MQEYHSFAHCTAGGCASIATSFIFTPSERIKQQMQVGSRYRNCWYYHSTFLSFITSYPSCETRFHRILSSFRSDLLASASFIGNAMTNIIVIIIKALAHLSVVGVSRSEGWLLMVILISCCCGESMSMCAGENKVSRRGWLRFGGILRQCCGSGEVGISGRVVRQSGKIWLGGLLRILLGLGYDVWLPIVGTFGCWGWWWGEEGCFLFFFWEH